MLIDGIDLSSLGVKLYNRVISSNEISTTEDWLDGDIQPTSIRQQDSFKSIRLAFLVLCTDEDAAFLTISKLTQALKKASLQFDDLNYTFDVSMTGYANPSRLKNGNFVVEYTFTSDYAKGERVVYTTNANLTNATKITVLYYQNSTTLLATDSVTIRASDFKDTGNTIASIGIDSNKYKPKYYENGTVTNLGNKELTYENLQDIGTLIVNYAPTSYNLIVNYYQKDSLGYYNELFQGQYTFTQPYLKTIQSIGQLVDVKGNKPEGYKGSVSYTGALTVEDILAASPINVFYDQVENEASKNITVTYYKENDAGTYDILGSQVILCKETEVTVGTVLGDIVTVNALKPTKYYSDGYIEEHSATELITYDTLELSYQVKYAKATTTVFVEYYVGTYPGWYRLASTSLTMKYKADYDTNFSITDIGIDLAKYHTAEYQPGVLYNSDIYTTYDSVVDSGVLQVYYKPIDYEISVEYSFVDGSKDPVTEKITINALDFMGSPALNDIVDITKYRVEGYQFSTAMSYDGEITLSGMTQITPIKIVYEEIEESRLKNIIVKYKQELASAFSTINTSIITVNESDCQGGVRLKDIINLNLYKPEYYESGVIDGASSSTLLDFDEIEANYSIVYLASSYSTPVRYYTDDVDDKNWVGSSSINYKIIDFTTTTTLYDLGFNLNLYKPTTCDDGVLQYTGAVNFTALRGLTSLNVVYDTVVEPEDDTIDYPHRFLFLQHNDMGSYEDQFPTWTMNHAFINTGVAVDDMSKLTVVMECERVDTNVPLYNVNVGYGYLFGSRSAIGSYFMRYNNQTTYGTNLTGVNTYEARAGLYSDVLVVSEENAVGFSSNSGIYTDSRDGYSQAVFTYTTTMQSDNAQMPYPLYLFANNNAGTYENGLAGIGIYSCRIYYDGTLIRDFIPVEYYDKIGDKIAPSNCLYDKITGSFFEDGTNKNSFNIKDDDRYTDTNLEHKIGHCYVNYYKGDTLIKNAAIYFRGSDFSTTYDPYEEFDVDGNQPSYYQAGVIQNYDSYTWDFDHMNNTTYTVVYASQENLITINYIQEDSNGIKTTLATDQLSITEKDFLQSPTFGDVVRINKYKPAGYETDFEYTGTKVSLARVLDLSPYTITYKPISGEVINYSTTIRYIKKVYGIRTYETIGTTTLTFDQSNFRDGEYIDYFIDMNLMKPEKYYGDGERYQWYEMDEKIDTPEKLKQQYTIVYNPVSQFIDMNYYTDEVDEANLIASNSYSFKIDSFEPGQSIYLVDIIPNNSINKYKPANCDSGILQNSNVAYTFEELAALSEIAIVYMTKVEPHDPEAASYEQKVLYWGEVNATDYLDECVSGRWFTGGKIPYIDLGYKPKDLSRLRVEMKCYARPYGFTAGAGTGGFISTDYLNFFGYYGPIGPEWLGVTSLTDDDNDLFGTQTQITGSPTSLAADYGINANGTGRGTSVSCSSSGCFAIRCRCPVASGWVYTSEGPQYIDGQTFYTAEGTWGEISGVTLKYTGMIGNYRKGFYSDFDDDLNAISAFNNYGFSIEEEEFARVEDGGTGNTYVCWGRTYETVTDEDGNSVVQATIPERTLSSCGNPYTIIMDAYNDYASVWRDGCSNDPLVKKFDSSGDTEIWEDICQPKGTLSLFQTTNPSTGEINMMPFNPTTSPYLGLSYALALSKNAIGNIYKEYIETSYEYEIIVKEKSTVIDSSYRQPTTHGSTSEGTGTEDYGTAADAETQWMYSTRTVSRNLLFASYPMDVYPQLTGCAVWYIKIYDRDRLVRDLIPVAKGDVIYDYTMPENGLFDLVTEIFFGNSNDGGTYEYNGYITPMNSGGSGSVSMTTTVKAEDVYPLEVILDPTIYGKTTTNYYDYDNTFIANQYVDVPVWYNKNNDTLEDLLRFNDYKPDDYHLDGLLDLDTDLSFESMTLRDIYDMGTCNVYYKLRTFTKTVVYYQDNVRIGSKDLFYSYDDIKKATTLDDLGIDKDLYYDSNFQHGRIVFDESILKDNDIAKFIDAPSPIVVYDKLTKEEAPNLLYLSYYRGGAYNE